MFNAIVTQRVVSIFFIFFTLFSFGVGDVFAQPSYAEVGEDISLVLNEHTTFVTREALVEDSVVATVKMTVARDEIWKIILGEVETGPLVNILEDDLSIALSGIVEIDGEEMLYIGVDGEGWTDLAKRDQVEIVLKNRFPDVPMIIEGSHGIHRLPQAETPLIFFDSPNFSVPDATMSQIVASVITVPNDVSIAGLSVEVHITHARTHDLRFDLVSPDGTVIVLHDHTGGSIHTVDDVSVAELNDLVGTGASGDWTLRIGDYLTGITGTLDTWTLTIIPQPIVAPPLATTAPGTIFSDDFSHGLNKWAVNKGGSDTGWHTKKPIADSVLGDDSNHSVDNLVVESHDCTAACSLELRTGITLSNYDSVILSFDRWIDDGLGAEEYLEVEVGNDGMYRKIFIWVPKNGDDLWHRETYTLTPSDLAASNFTVRFSAKNGLSGAVVAIDNVTIASPQALPTPSSSPPSQTCFDGPDRDIPMGGDKVFARSVLYPSWTSCGTMTLGGVEKKDGKRGFITAAHVASRMYNDTNVLLGHTLQGGSIPGSAVQHPLGKVDSVPLAAYLEPSALTQSGKNFVYTDSVFVEYPRTSTCQLSWSDGVRDFCFQHAYLERAISKEVRGDNTTYAVVGSQSPVNDLSVVIFGATTRKELRGRIRFVTGPSPRVRNGALLLYNGGKHEYLYLIDTVSAPPQLGDSGAPVYTEPNSNNEVNMVGLYTGDLTLMGATYHTFSSWDDVQSTLDLVDL